MTAAGTMSIEASLRDLIDALGQERAALAAFDYTALAGSRTAKEDAAASLAGVAANDAGEAIGIAAVRALAEEARVMNAANGAMMRLLIANVDARLAAMTGAVPLYRPGASTFIARALA